MHLKPNLTVISLDLLASEGPEVLVVIEVWEDEVAVLTEEEEVQEVLAEAVQEEIEAALVEIEEVLAE